MYLLIILMALGSACGSSALPQASIPAPGFVVTGTVESPTSSSISALSKGLVKRLTETAASGITCNLYTLEGETLGSATTQSDGTFSISIITSELKGSTDSGTSWSELVALECSNGMQTLVEISVDETSTTTVSLGTANTTTTLTAMTMAQQLEGWQGWGQDLRTAASTLDLGCHAQIQESLWQNADLSGEGIADDFELLNRVCQGFIASGRDPVDFGYSTRPALIKAILDGSLSSTALDTLAGITASLDNDLSQAVILNNYASAYGATNAARQSFATQLGSSGAAIGAASLKNQVSAESGSVCDQIRDGTINPDILAKPVLAALDATDVASTFSGDGMAVLIGLAQTCFKNDNCAAMEEKPAAFHEFMRRFDGNFGEIFNEQTGFDSSNLDGIFFASASCEATTAGGYRECAHGMFETIQAGGGFDQFVENGVLDDERIDLLGGVWTGRIAQGYDPDDLDTSQFEDLYNEFHSSFGTDDATVRACIDELIAQQVFDTSRCYPDSFTGFEETNFTSGSGSGSPPPLTLQSLTGNYVYQGSSGCSPSFENVNIAVSQDPNRMERFVATPVELQVTLPATFQLANNTTMSCSATLQSSTCSSCSLSVVNNGGTGTSIMVQQCQSSCSLHYFKP